MTSLNCIFLFAKVVEMASSKRQLEKKIEELEEEVDEQAEQIQLLEQVREIPCLCSKYSCF